MHHRTVLGLEIGLGIRGLTTLRTESWKWTLSGLRPRSHKMLWALHCRVIYRQVRERAKSHQLQIHVVHPPRRLSSQRQSTKPQHKFLRTITYLECRASLSILKPASLSLCRRESAKHPVVGLTPITHLLPLLRALHQMLREEMLLQQIQVD